MLTLLDRKGLVIFSFYVVYKSGVPTIHLWHLFLKNTDFGYYAFGFVVGELFSLGIVGVGLKDEAIFKYFLQGISSFCSCLLLSQL